MTLQRAPNNLSHKSSFIQSGELFCHQRCLKHITRCSYTVTIRTSPASSSFIIVSLINHVSKDSHQSTISRYTKKPGNVQSIKSSGQSIPSSRKRPSPQRPFNRQELHRPIFSANPRAIVRLRRYTLISKTSVIHSR